MDHIPRQHKIEAAIVERQRIDRSLAHAQRDAVGLRRLAHDREAGRTAVDRLDGELILGEQQRVPDDAAAEIERGAGAARLELRQERDHIGLGIKPVRAALGGRPSLVPGFDRGRECRRHHRPPASR
jgi:hypothetical protein